MSGASIQPERAWQAALDQLRHDMPKASFDTWVRDTSFVSFEGGVFTISTPNAYGREWLAGRLTSTLTRLMTGILNQTVYIQFLVAEGDSDCRTESDEAAPEAVVSPEKRPAVLSLQAEYQTIYDEIVQPERIIVVPGYFLRYIPLLGLELAWLYIGFRQAAYEAGASRQPGKKFGAPSKKVAHYAGMSLRTFWRWAAKTETWQRLRWLVKQVDSEPRWSRGKDGRPHQSAHYYRVAMSLPLTPFDERSLRAWLYRHLAQGSTAVEVIKTALETPVAELIPWPDTVIPDDETTDEPCSVQDVLQAVCGSITESQRAQFQELSNKLAQHLMPPKDLVFLTHYFVSQWLPQLGPGPGWFVTLLRDRGYINPRTGELRNEILVSEGYAGVARWLGLKRVKTVWEWLRIDDVSVFIRETGREAGAWEDAPRRFKVCLGEPMTEIDQARANELLADRGIGAPDTHRPAIGQISVGASDTHSADQNAGFIGAIGTHNGVPGIHKRGASGTLDGGDDTHSNGASDTPDWRDWHSLNTLALGLNHSNNTPTTSEADIDFEMEASSSNDEQEAVGVAWDLPNLLERNRVSAKNQALLLEKDLTAQAFISWLFYAASPAGSGIRDPIAHAISRLLSDPKRGAGSVFDQLAGLPANQLANLLIQALEGYSLRHPGWHRAMAGATRDHLLALADQLGVDVPASGYS